MKYLNSYEQNEMFTRLVVIVTSFPTIIPQLRRPFKTTWPWKWQPSFQHGRRFIEQKEATSAESFTSIDVRRAGAIGRRAWRSLSTAAHVRACVTPALEPDWPTRLLTGWWTLVQRINISVLFCIVFFSQEFSYLQFLRF